MAQQHSRAAAGRVRRPTYGATRLVAITDHGHQAIIVRVHCTMGGSSDTPTASAATTADQDLSEATASLARRVISRITGGTTSTTTCSSAPASARSQSASAFASSGTYVRRAHHAGSWYSSNAEHLDATLGRYLSDAEGKSSAKSGTRAIGGSDEVPRVPRAIISPHAGFDYSGPAAAHAYLALKEALMAAATHHCSGAAHTDFTIVVLHPSHHVYLSGGAVSGATELQTPLGNLLVDGNLRSQLLHSGKFSIMERHVDEAEHSGEMQYPYIAKVINDALGEGSTKSLHVRVLPIMIGATSTSQEQKFGLLLAPYLAQPNIFTVVSSDFCHWGKRFSYYPHLSTNPDDGTPFNQIADYIEWLDRKGMNGIEMQDPGAFATYLREHSNTICGRHPIAVWLHSVATNGQDGIEKVNVMFVDYDQSSRVATVDESSVSCKSSRVESSRCIVPLHCLTPLFNLFCCFFSPHRCECSSSADIGRLYRSKVAI